jgi:beta-phosphoglucomutase-like phosphatase (HAD superfamily)
MHPNLRVGQAWSPEAGEKPAREGAMGIRGVIFDLDGTLADTIPVCISAFRSVFERYSGRRWDEEEIKALSGPTAQIQSRAR